MLKRGEREGLQNDIHQEFCVQSKSLSNPNRLFAKNQLLLIKLMK